MFSHSCSRANTLLAGGVKILGQTFVADASQSWSGVSEYEPRCVAGGGDIYLDAADSRQGVTVKM